MSETRRPIVIKRPKIVKGHHGGGWKIAYADFMTAMMAFFLVMWVISNASDEDLREISDYFGAPLEISLLGGDRNSASSSAIPGGGFMAEEVQGEKGADVSRMQRQALAEEARFADIRDEIDSIMSQQMREDPSLAELREQLQIELTAEGLRIQITDSDQHPMFALGSKQPSAQLSQLLSLLAPILARLPNHLSITGHTDNRPFVGEGGYGNWELSTDRANVARRVLVAHGLAVDRIVRVVGMGSRISLDSQDPQAAVNRRISLMVLSHTAYREITDSNGVNPRPAENIDSLRARLEQLASPVRVTNPVTDSPVASTLDS
ncbi:flagellar motor protein MotB [Cobetia sp. 5-11-6-3]|uniref:flagellar motor protein MotB n=1 Tax=Cobetia sp. 5-11-6-3 TaxID=2737458 RepID=UPI0015968590|nr:flagellar motor protein MotB [Cobetia sp. 5-11-6-3]